MKSKFCTCLQHLYFTPIIYHFDFCLFYSIAKNTNTVKNKKKCCEELLSMKQCAKCLLRTWTRRTSSCTSECMTAHVNIIFFSLFGVCRSRAIVVLRQVREKWRTFSFFFSFFFFYNEISKECNIKHPSALPLTEYLLFQDKYSSLEEILLITFVQRF